MDSNNKDNVNDQVEKADQASDSGVKVTQLGVINSGKKFLAGKIIHPHLAPRHSNASSGDGDSITKNLIGQGKDITRESESSATSSSTMVTTLPSSSEMASEAHDSSASEQKSSQSGSDEFVASSSSDEAPHGNSNENSGNINPTSALYWEYNYGSSFRERGSISSEQYSQELCIYLFFAFVFCVVILAVLLVAYFFGN